MKDYLEINNIAGSVIGIGIAGFATGGLSLIPSIIGAVAGSIFVEGAEEVEEDIKSAVIPAYRSMMIMLSLRNAAKNVGYISNEG